MPTDLYSAQRCTHAHQNCHIFSQSRMQTLLRPLFKRVPKPKYEEEMVSFSDGGEVKLSWYSDPPNVDESCPIAIILPGLTGCACSHYIATIVRSIAQQGYRCVVLNNRGTCDQKLKTPRTYSASDTEDVSEVISLIHRRYPRAPLTAVGISLGALILFNYISSFGEEAVSEANDVELVPKMENGGKKCPLQAGMCISMLWKLGESSRSLERPLDWLLFNRPLTSLLCRIVHRNADVLSDKFDVPRILRSRSVREFDENLTVDMFGYSSVEEYYNQASPALKLDTVKVPLLCFVAADDPFVPLSSIVKKVLHCRVFTPMTALKHLDYSRAKATSYFFLYGVRSRSVREFDENLTVDMFGYSSVEEYYNQASPALKLDTVKVPLLCFVAADDPFVPLSSIPLDAIAKSSHVMLVLTKHGGHIGFLDSLLPTGPNLMDRAAAQFCSAVFENLEELSVAARDQTVAAELQTVY
ncbi:Phospholipase abhd3 [Sparganum proliferum]